MESFDVVVVGCGFAGAIAARESRADGKSVLVLEGRERLGGRTWYRKFQGTDQGVEIGGTWIAPDQQKFVQAELERYKVQTFQSPVASNFGWGLNGEMLNTAFPIPADEWAALEHAIVQIDKDADRIRFYEAPLGQPGLEDLDIPYSAYVDALNVPAKTRDFLLAWPTFYFGAYPQELSALHVISWVSGFGSSVGWYTLLTDKFVGGTKSLIEHILAEAETEVRYNTVVASIADEGTQVRVVTRDGQTILARSIIVTAPLNTWERINFVPELPHAHRAMATEKQAGQSVKVWALVPKLERDFYGIGIDTTFKWIASEYTTDDGTYLCCFASAEADIDATDLDAVTNAVRQFLPEATVLAVDSHDWNKDEFSLGTWMAYRPGQVMKYSNHLQVPHGRIHFANSDLASGWAGWIDGAIESAFTAANASNLMLASERMHIPNPPKQAKVPTP
ncbi:NAD(P)/FAD-dependent oxidoreductase [Arthrobacter sp. NtRootA1]|uniref:flavin monoamine oxidase family protein n=1 Tax=Micrococcaceae TaxID=1268 RepID=UPI001CC43881|nr:NAD(P)/FAD-dependent oxidoreductase [Arthrobacter sp. NtRootA1]